MTAENIINWVAAAAVVLGTTLTLLGVRRNLLAEKCVKAAHDATHELVEKLDSAMDRQRTQTIELMRLGARLRMAQAVDDEEATRQVLLEVADFEAKRVVND